MCGARALYSVKKTRSSSETRDRTRCNPRSPPPWAFLLLDSERATMSPLWQHCVSSPLLWFRQTPPPKWRPHGPSFHPLSSTAATRTTVHDGWSLSRRRHQRAFLVDGVSVLLQCGDGTLIVHRGF